MRNKTGRITRLLCVAALSVSLFSCGYQLIRDKGLFNGEITSLYVPVFKNVTYEPNLSEYVTEAFSRELLSTSLFTLNKEKADGYLQGTVTRIATQGTSINPTSGVAIEKTVTLDTELALYRQNGTFIKRWKLTDVETYRVDNDYEDYSKKDAIRRLSARMARRFSSILLLDY